MASYHRCARIQEHLPWVDERLRPDLGSVLARHLARAEPALLNRDEAIAFCDHLEQETPLDPPYIAELARYERLRISVAWGRDGGGAAPRVATFAFPIPRVLDALGEPGWPLVERSPVRLVFKKVPGIPAIIIVG